MSEIRNHLIAADATRKNHGVQRPLAFGGSRAEQPKVPAGRLRPVGRAAEGEPWPYLSMPYPSANGGLPLEEPRDHKGCLCSDRHRHVRIHGCLTGAVGPTTTAVAQRAMTPNANRWQEPDIVKRTASDPMSKMSTARIRSTRQSESERSLQWAINVLRSYQYGNPTSPPLPRRAGPGADRLRGRPAGPGRAEQASAAFEPAPMPFVRYGPRGSTVSVPGLPVPPKMPPGTGAVPVSSSSFRGAVSTGLRESF